MTGFLIFAGSQALSGCLMCDGELVTERDVMHALGKMS